MTRSEHASYLQGVSSWLEVLETGKAEAIPAVMAGMRVAISNLKNMQYCESCKEMVYVDDMENSRYCKLCVIVMDDMDAAWTENDKDLRLGGIA